MNGAQATLLLVDDEADIRESLRYILRQRGHQTLEARDGKEALQALRSCKICGVEVDLVVTDIRMPNMDGLDLLSGMAEQGYFMPTLVLTGYGDSRTQLLTLLKGGAALLEKPVGEESFMGMVNCLLERGGKADRIAAVHADLLSDCYSS